MIIGGEMPNIEKDFELIKNWDEIDSHMYAVKIIDAYHNLHEKGYNDLNDLLLEFSCFGIKNEFLQYAFETHLIYCDYCVEKLTRYKFVDDTIQEYGKEALETVKARESNRKLLEEIENRTKVAALIGLIIIAKKVADKKPFLLKIRKPIITMGEDETPEFNMVFETAKFSDKGGSHEILDPFSETKEIRQIISMASRRGWYFRFFSVANNMEIEKSPKKAEPLEGKDSIEIDVPPSTDVLFIAVGPEQELLVLDDKLSFRPEEFIEEKDSDIFWIIYGPGEDSKKGK